MRLCRQTPSGQVLRISCPEPQGCCLHWTVRKQRHRGLLDTLMGNLLSFPLLTSHKNEIGYLVSQAGKCRERWASQGGAQALWKARRPSRLGASSVHLRHRSSLTPEGGGSPETSLGLRNRSRRLTESGDREAQPGRLARRERAW